MRRWKIRTQFVGDDGWTHEPLVEGPPTPGDKFIDVVPAERLQRVEAFLRAEQKAILARGDGRELASADDEARYDAIERCLQES